MRFDILDRIVAGVGIECIHRVHAVAAITSAVAAFENLHVNPGVILRGAAEGNHAQIADAGVHLLGHGLR